MKLSSRISTALVISLLLTLTLLNSAGASGVANWPQWRGPDGQGANGNLFIRGERHLFAIGK
ncbi:MAG: hypothetical protein ACR2HX_01620 [Pyrinomonadaceae bacterium]